MCADLVGMPAAHPGEQGRAAATPCPRRPALLQVSARQRRVAGLLGAATARHSVPPLPARSVLAAPLVARALPAVLSLRRRPVRGAPLPSRRRHRVRRLPPAAPTPARQRRLRPQVRPSLLMDGWLLAEP